MTKAGLAVRRTSPAEKGAGTGQHPSPLPQLTRTTFHSWSSTLTSFHWTTDAPFGGGGLCHTGEQAAAHVAELVVAAARAGQGPLLGVAARGGVLHDRGARTNRGGGWPNGELRFQDLVRDWYRPLWHAGVAVDFVRPDADLSSYRLVLVPSLYLVDDGGAANLTGFAERGGTLVVHAWLRELGSLPPDAPGTLRYLAITSGQVSMEQLVDRFGLQCRPVRDLLVDYLKERQPALDYTSLNNLSRHLARNFWRDLERHHPGIESLNLTPEVASAWKQRSRTWVEKRRQSDGSLRETVTTRANVASIMLSVRAFYLDIAQWAIDEPTRWGPWAAPCPVNDADVAVVKHNKRRKARMDHRTPTQLDEEQASRRRVIDLGMPTFSQIAPHFSAATNPLSC
jgi:hypothetical protein